MKCPVCKEPDLVMTERQNIEIDYCPQCRGVWLDRGELDKIIERSQQEEMRYAAMPVPAPSATPSQGQSQPSTASTFLQPPPGGFNDASFGDRRSYYDSGHHDSRHRDSGHDGSRGGFLRRLFD